MKYRKSNKKTKIILIIVLACVLTAGAVLTFVLNYNTIIEQQRARELALLMEKYPRGYSEYVVKYCAEYDVPEHIAYAVIKAESNFRADAVSRAGAIGLMQMMPDTLYWVNSKIHEDYTVEQLTDPEINIKCGIFLLHFLYTNDFSDWDCTFAAYNAGRGRVLGWLKDPAVSEDGKLVNIPIAETASYVKIVNNYSNKYYEIYYGTEGETDNA